MGGSNEKRSAPPGAVPLPTVPLPPSAFPTGPILFSSVLNGRSLGFRFLIPRDIFMPYSCTLPSLSLLKGHSPVCDRSSDSKTSVLPQLDPLFVVSHVGLTHHMKYQIHWTSGIPSLDWKLYEESVWLTAIILSTLLWRSVGSQKHFLNHSFK